ncbi:MAG: transporter substrate-binding domain-containing protein [Candidatus Thorarchaeota archaeon]|nr:transporter substrate-binding domain-containing protein [Candidatus Thorarchaeota archaeon]
MSHRNTTAIAFLIIGLVIGLGIGIVIPTITTADNSLANVTTRGTLIVGTSADYPPFESLDSENNVVGFDADLMEYIGDYMNVTIVWQNMDFDSLVGACSAGTIDVIAAAMFISEERAAVLSHSIPYLQTEMSIVAMNDSSLSISNLEDLSGETVGVQTGSIEDTTISDVSGVSVTRFATADLMFAALDAGTVDAIFVDTPVVTVYMSTYNIKTILTMAAELTVLYAGLNANSLMIQMNAAISQALQDGTIDGLIQEWL